MNKETSVFLYLIIFIFSCFFIEIGIRKKKKLQNFYTFLGILLPTFLATFRSPTVGTDTQMYQYMFEGYLKIPNLFERLRILGFKEFLNTAIAQIGVFTGSFNIYIFIFSFVTLLIIIKSLYVYENKNTVSVSYFVYLCLFFPQSLNIMRQSLAIAIVFWGLQYILKKNPRKYLITILLAVGVHVSALIALPLYFLLNKERRINYLVATVLSGVIIWGTLSIGPIFNLISSIPGFERYSFYATFVGEINNRIMIVNIFIFVVIFALKKYFTDSNNLNRLLLLMLFFGLLLGLTGFVSPYIKRLGAYFDIVQVLLISQIGNIFLNKYQNLIIKYGICIICIIYFIVFYYYIESSSIIPYDFYIY
ncbi:EpsG family protein [Enterococcus dongliensis]|uniref:EpsG family protein n=1 Tax=Enterococcus dongliensis TaxID=2559925 RepID=UPI00289228C8|nr:EpsG family protein [Enterococcus dongliensis]MDT2671922.1 EpsG family protein [Enterococcus dongliensis]